jgi:ABC-type multidrug transport system fused ATPase/permease subunit
LHYLRPRRRRLGALVLVLVVSALLPLLGPILLGRFIDAAADGQPTSVLVTIAFVSIANAIAAESLSLLVTWQTERLSWQAGNQMREDLTDKVLHLDMAWHGRHTPGELIERIDGDVENVWGYFTAFILDVASNALLIVGVLVAVSVIDLRVSAALLAFAAVATLVLVALRRFAVSAAETERAAGARLYGELEERLSGIEDLRANGAASYVWGRFRSLAIGHIRAQVTSARRGGGSYGLTMIVLALGTGVVLWVGLTLHREGAISAGTILVLFRFSQMVRTPLERIAEQLREVQKALAGARRAARLLAVEPAVAEGSGVGLPSGPLALDIDHVDFAYDDGEPVLHDLDLHLPPGTVLGLVGRTGSGKTTVGRLLLRLYETEHGTVRVGGLDVRDIDTAVFRRRVAAVTQDVQLFTASVRDNLTVFGARDASDRDLHEVLAAIDLDGWIAHRGDLDTALDPLKLSAGEAQLLALGRALLADPGLVILDEASSRLDPVTEARVAAATRRLLAGRTAIIVAHRLATLDVADEIAVLDHGRLVEHGRRSALLADPTSVFGRLARVAA